MHAYRLIPPFCISVLTALSAVIWACSGARAQSACSQTLIRAQVTYYEGRANEVPAILEPCLESGFTREDKIQAYYLLTLTYLYLNETHNAETALFAFLRLNPEYRVSEGIDPTEFINLYKKFRTWPVYLVGIKLGGNLTNAHLRTPYGTNNVLTDQSSYTARPGYQVGVMVEIPLTRRFSVMPELYLSGNSYQYRNRLFNYANLTLVERQTWVKLPVRVTSYFGKQKWQPFIGGGVELGYLLNARAQARRTDSNLDSVTSEPANGLQREVTGPDIRLHAQRNPFTISATLGGGFKFKSGRNTVVLDVRYYMTLLNAVRTKNRYTNTELIYRYGYVDSNFTTRTAAISLGYLVPIYRPKLLPKKVSTQ